MPPNRRPSMPAQVEHAKVQPRRRANADPLHRQAHSLAALEGCDATYCAQQVPGLPLPRTGGLLHQHLEPVELLLYLCLRKHVDPGGEDGRLEHRVLRPVEADELPPPPPMDDPRINAGAGRGGVDGLDLELVPGACRLEHQPATFSAGRQGNCGLLIAAWANRSTSSTRLNTAQPVAETLRKVVVSRKGLRTSRSSPHSRPIGAKLTSPPASRVVMMPSTIIGN